MLISALFIENKVYFQYKYLSFFCQGNNPEASLESRPACSLLIWLLRHIELLICLNASIRRTQFAWL